MRSMLSGWLVALMLGLSALSTAEAQNNGKKFQCWTDDKGQRACGDRVPPQYAQRERQVFDANGRVVEVKPRQKTPEEVAELERQAKAAAEQRQRDEVQQSYDRFLLSTFNTPKELEKMRDDRIATIDGRLGLAEKSVADNEAALHKLRERAAAAEKDGKAVPERMAKQIRQFETTLRDNQAGIAQMRAERLQIDTKFAADLERLKILRGTVTVPAAQ
jgi:hypothetical protein